MVRVAFYVKKSLLAFCSSVAHQILVSLLHYYPCTTPNKETKLKLGFNT